MNFNFEIDKFKRAVDEKAADLVSRGIVAPYEAIEIARNAVLAERRRKNITQHFTLTPEAGGLRNGVRRLVLNRVYDLRSPRLTVGGSSHNGDFDNA